MKISKTHDLIRGILKKENKGFISHERIDEALDLGQMDQLVFLLGAPEGYRPGRPIPTVAYGMTQKIHNDLGPFKVDPIAFNENTYNSNSNQYGTGPDGILRLPTDYLHCRAIYGTEYNNQIQANKVRPIKILNEDQIAERLDSHIIQPTEERPVALLGGVTNGQYRIQFFPETGKTGQLYYLRRPVAPKYAYTLNGRTETFDAGNSIDLEWNDAAVNQVIYKALGILGVPIEDPMSIQFSQYKDSNGS